MNFRQPIAFLKNNSIEIFYLLLSLSIFTRIVEDIYLNRIAIYEGILFPWRHLGIIPLYSSVAGLYLEYVISGAGAALMLLSRYRRWGVCLGAIGLLMSLSQLFQNQKILICILLLSAFICPPEKSRRGRDFLRWQLVFVYLFAGLSKFDSFWNGEVLAILSQEKSHYGLLGEYFWSCLSSQAIVFFSKAVVVTELVLPLLLFKCSFVAWLLVLVLHLGFSLVMVDIFSFSLTMLALATLFFCDSPKNTQA